MSTAIKPACVVCGDVEGKGSIELRDPECMVGPIETCPKCGQLACPGCIGEWCCYFAGEGDE